MTSEGIIMKALSGFYYVDDGQTVTACRGRGKLRRDKVTPLVGDRVRFTPLEKGSGALDEILPRKNEFFRPAVANIDQLVVIASQAIPVTDPFLIDRVAAIAEAATWWYASTSAIWPTGSLWPPSTGRRASGPSWSAPRPGRA